MIEIDGSRYSGSGTILRYAVSLAALLRKELHIRNIRAKRRKPGLRPQHLRSVLACRDLTDGVVSGAEIGSSELVFHPGPSIKGGEYSFDIGTAGSTTMLLLTFLPLACFAEDTIRLKLSGGLFQDFAPSAFYMEYVLLCTLFRMGLCGGLKMVRPGYVPSGGGILEVEIKPVKGKLQSIRLVDQGEIEEFRGIALSSHLKAQRVNERMVAACQKALKKKGCQVMVELKEDETSLQKGAAFFLLASTTTGLLLGMDQAGKIGRSAEKIGDYVAKALLEDIEKGATVDRYLADQLIIFAALAEGASEYIIPYQTDHIRSNLWLVEEILGAKAQLNGQYLRIEGIAFDVNRQ